MTIDLVPHLKLHTGTYAEAIGGDMLAWQILPAGAISDDVYDEIHARTMQLLARRVGDPRTALGRLHGRLSTWGACQ